MRHFNTCVGDIFLFLEINPYEIFHMILLRFVYTETKGSEHRLNKITDRTLDVVF